MLNSGLYIHIPFCENKCTYCNFFSVTSINSESLFKKYLDCLIKEYDIRAADFKSDIDTVYIGGGTPSIVGYKLLDNFLGELMKRLSGIKEITVEFNINHVNTDILDVISKVKNVRISLGVETFNEKILETINRKTKIEDIEKSLKLINKYSIDNISLDFICALPYSDIKTTKDDISRSLDLTDKIKHISLYYLELEDAIYRKWRLILPDEDTAISSHEAALEVLNSSGFKRYEVSNFAKSENYISKHNMHYWHLDDYIALGASAVGCYDDIRYKNTVRIKDYIKYLDEGFRAPFTEEYLNLETRKKEFIFLSLRTISGISLKNYERLFKEDFLTNYSDIILKNSEYFHVTNEYIYVYEKYFNYVDEISLLLL